MPVNNLVTRPYVRRSIDKNLEDVISMSIPFIRDPHQSIDQNNAPLPSERGYAGFNSMTIGLIDKQYFSHPPLSQQALNPSLINLPIL